MDCDGKRPEVPQEVRDPLESKLMALVWRGYRRNPEQVFGFKKVV